ncbi:MAG: ABC transporter permease [Clostridia bacterium BRH_c25]|nr:MAG: ABC transporter permease [Clostridia bacterium BRH_c25]
MKIRKILWIVLLLAAWQGIAVSGRFSPLIFPSLGMISQSLVNSLLNGELVRETVFSIVLILEGLIIGMLLAAVMSIASITSKWLRDLIETVTALAHPLPGIALLPIIILWLGTGRSSVVFIIVHSVVWPLLLNITAGFKATPRIYRDTAQNFGVRGIDMFKDVYVPASLPFLISGLKIAWARSWRALISAEMIFGAVGGKGGLGWYIFKQRVFMDTAGMFSALFIIILIGIIVEEIVFEKFEAATIRKWGMAIYDGEN